MASLSFKKLSKLKSLVDEVLAEADALTPEGSPAEGLATATKIIKNALSDIRVDYVGQT